MKCDRLKTADRFHSAVESHTVVRVFLAIISGDFRSQHLPKWKQDSRVNSLYLPAPSIQIFIDQLVYKKLHLLLFSCSVPARTPNLTSCSYVNVATADIITFTHMDCIVAGYIGQNKHDSSSCAVVLLAYRRGFTAHCQRAKRVGIATVQWHSHTLRHAHMHCAHTHSWSF